jgi:hypothetical protein
MVAAQLVSLLPAEVFDPQFHGQALETTYFDSPDYDLRKARRAKQRYITIRLRCYGDDEAYALSAKTESEKWRQELDPATAHQLLADASQLPGLLPAHLRARLTELGANELVPVVTACCHRYAVEDDQDRLTLDCCVHTDRGKQLGYGVLEFKSTQPDKTPTGRLSKLGLRPLKLSKFLWATDV